MKPAGRSLFTLVIALTWLHALVSFRYPWENIAFHESWLRGSLDLAALVGLGWVASLTNKGRCFRPHALTVATLFLPLFRFAHTVMPVFYGKELDPYNDADMLPGLVHLLLHRYGFFVQAALVLGVVAIAVGFYFATLRAWQRVSACFQRDAIQRPKLVVAGLGLFLVAGTVDTAPDDESVFATPFLADDIARSGVSIADSWREFSAFDERLEEARRRLDGVPTDLAHLRGADVYVVFIESYGACILRDPERRAQLESWSAEWTERLEQHGFHMATGLAFPSVRGGNSSMAHAEFMSGTPVRTRRTFDRLLASDVRSLPGFFRDAGYRAINVQPGMPRAWDEGSFFGFTEDVFQPQLPYAGRAYHWGTMPDQYALAYFLHEYVVPSDKPVFAQYVSVTSHAPFSMIPPNIADWKAAATSEPYEAPPAHDFGIGWLDYSGHPELADAYMESIRYSLDTTFAFLCELPRDSIAFVLGDHQPPQVGEFQEADLSFDVPVHVVAKDPRVTGAVETFGFRSGFLPDLEFGSFPTYRILSLFLETFSGGEAQAR